VARGSRLVPLALLCCACAESGAAPGASSAPRPADEDDLWSMLPAEADLVLWADLGKLRASPWTRESFDRIAPGEGHGGLPPEQLRNVERVVFAKVPSFADGASVLIARGAIDRAAVVKAFAKDAGPGTSSYYRGAELIARGDQSLAFLGRRTVLSGLTVAVRAALDCNFGVAPAVEGESWFRRMRAELVRGRDEATMVAALYVHPLPATREALMREMGEGGTLQDFSARVDLGGDLDLAAWALVTSETEARDLAARLSERLRDVGVRPIVTAFGFGSVLESIRLEHHGPLVSVTAHVSQAERQQIAARMAATAEMMTKMHNTEEKPR
jgi:hypothetical protein